ncbi:MAG: hypothetical protein HYZ45_09260 [Burkholderiales bacterium]|nr:hypothetical protein [Burkholderiales bacterium]
MSDSPYAPPQSFVNRDAEREIEPVPEQILKNIDNGWKAGAVSTVFTFLFTLVGLSESNKYGFSAWNFLDVLLIAGLTIGIYKKSRVCAGVMLTYFIISKVIMIIESGQLQGGAIGLVFLYFYGKALQGTLDYHKHMQQQ